MNSNKIQRSALWAAVGAVVILIFTIGLAAPSNAAAFPPELPCGAHPKAPEALTPSQDRTGYYLFTTQGPGEFDCTGTIYASSVTSVLHYKTEEDGAVVKSLTGAATSATHNCSGTCTAYAYFVRTGLWCGGIYTYDDYVQMTGWWQKTASATKVSFSVTGPTTHGSSYEPPGPCS